MSLKSEVIKGFAKYVGQNKKKVIALLNESGYPTRKSITVEGLLDKIQIVLRSDGTFAKKITAAAFPDVAQASAKGMVISSADGSQPRIRYAVNSIVVDAADGSEEVQPVEAANLVGPDTGSAKIQVDPLEAATEILKDTISSQSTADKKVTAVIATEQDEKSQGLMGIYYKFPLLSLLAIVALLIIAGYYASKWLGLLKK